MYSYKKAAAGDTLRITPTAPGAYYYRANILIRGILMGRLYCTFHANFLVTLNDQIMR